MDVKAVGSRCSGDPCKGKGQGGCLYAMVKERVLQAGDCVSKLFDCPMVQRVSSA